jgi:hypothetical protein
LNPSLFYGLFADLILVFHFAYVSFVVLGLLVIWMGYFRGWPFVRDFWFRLAHLLTIGFVTAESLTGIACPLTTWENELRLRARGGSQYQGSFVQHWIHRVMFYDASEATFTVIHIVFFSAVLLSLWFVKPRGPFSQTP